MEDANETAFRVMQESTAIFPTPQQERDIFSKMMRELGSKGGKIGGKRRMETMTKEARGAIAQKAANARWAKKPVAGA